MSQAGFALERLPSLALARRRHATRRALTATLLWAVPADTAAAIVYLWVHSGNGVETLKARSANVSLVSGATDTSQAFAESLHSAILKAKRA
jgi:hypothetical protein